MALNPDFPESPYTVLDPEIHWFPADEVLRETSMDKLMLPLVPKLRKNVKECQGAGYAGASDTSRFFRLQTSSHRLAAVRILGSLFDL